MAEVNTVELKLDPKYDHYTYPTMNPTTGPGHPGHTTPEHDALVAKFREELEKEGHTERLDTISLVRFPLPPSPFSHSLFPRIDVANKVRLAPIPEGQEV